ncbi:MAG: pyruvate kinase [Thermoplasmata archaeon]|nr:pyruvate kinase [Thermoplasmata archaeon]
MRRTKILATVGPATKTPDQMIALITAGADGLRLNLAHGSTGDHQAYLRTMHVAARQAAREVAIVADVPGPKLRLGEITNDQIRLVVGDGWSFDSESAPGDGRRVRLELPSFRGAAKAGDPILLGDGSVELRVTSAGPNSIEARVVNGGIVRSRAGAYLPHARLTTGAFDASDRKRAEVALAEGIDFLALSFVRDSVDLVSARRWLDKQPDGKEVGLIAKIERAEALKSIDGILADADGIMIARGDLGIEVALEKLPLEQKDLIGRANAAGRFAIVATQVLLSMVNSPRPTRAEATDVANAVLDGADAIMLSEESTVGHFPVEAIQWLDRIARATESAFDPRRTRELVRAFPSDPTSAPERAVAAAAVTLAEAVHASVIVTPTHTGHTARLIAALRPACPVVALTRRSLVRRRLALVRGVEARPSPTQGKIMELRHQAIELARTEGLAELGPIVLTLGFPVDGRPTNLVTLLDPSEEPPAPKHS